MNNRGFFLPIKVNYYMKIIIMCYTMMSKNFFEGIYEKI